MNEYLSLLKEIELHEELMVTEPENVFYHLEQIKNLEAKLENILRSGFF